MLKLSTHMQTLKRSSWRTFSIDKERTLENTRCESQNDSPQREFFSRSGRKMNIRNGNRFLCWAHMPVLTVWGTRWGKREAPLKQSWRNALGFQLSSSCRHKHSTTDSVTELWRPGRRSYQSDAIILASCVLPWKGKSPAVSPFSQKDTRPVRCRFPTLTSFYIQCFLMSTALNHCMRNQGLPYKLRRQTSN